MSFFGCQTKEDLLGHSPVDFSPTLQPDGQSSQQKALNLIATALSGKPLVFYWKHQRSDHLQIDAEVSLTNLNINGKNCLLAIVRDITERVERENKIEQDKIRSETITRVTTTLVESLELQDVLNRICEEIARVLDVPLTTIRLLDAEQDLLVIRAGYGLPEALIFQMAPVPMNSQPAFPVISDRTYIINNIDDLVENPNIELYHRLGIRSIMVCNLVHAGKFLGSLNLSYKEQKELSDDDLAMVNTLSNSAALVIYNASLFEQVKAGRQRLQGLSKQLIEVQEAERRRLAIELHDEIGQVLSNIKMSIERYDPKDPGKVDLEKVKAITTDLIQRVRNLSLELRPAILDDLGLLPATLWHIENYTAMTGIQVEFLHTGINQRFETQIESTAYRVLQEALTNIARYSKAAHINVSLWADEHELSLQVEDDGVGFDKNAVKEKHTTGLSSMQERTALCGGNLTINSSPGQGTYISMHLPINSLFMERRKR